MYRHSLLLSLCFSLFVGTFVGCTSYTVKYPEDFKNKTIDAAVTMQLCEPSTDASNMGFLYKKDFVEKESPQMIAFMKVALASQMDDKIKKIPVEAQKKVRIDVTPAVLALKIPQTALTKEEQKVNPYITKYNFDSVKKQIKTPYIFDVKVTSCIYDGGFYTLNVSGYASIYEVATGKIIWGDTFAYYEDQSQNLFTLLARRSKKMDTQENVNKRMDEATDVIMSTLSYQMK